MREKLVSFLENSMNYREFMDLMRDLVLSKSTTGEIDETRVKFTALNFTRSQRLNKKLQLSESEAAFFQELRMQQTWLVITESWCGDAAQTLPVLPAPNQRR
ncbi:thioredoxin family protein [Salinimicrobium sp. CAU 1759]